MNIDLAGREVDYARLDVPGPIILPPELPGAAPHGDEAPEAVLFMRIYAGFFVLTHLVLFVAGVFVMVEPQLAPSPVRGLAIENLIGGVFYMAWGLGFAAPWLVLLWAGRRSWAHTMGSILVAFTMMSMCCVPAAIPLLIAWNKPAVKKYFTA